MKLYPHSLLAWLAHKARWQAPGRVAATPPLRAPRHFASLGHGAYQREHATHKIVLWSHLFKQYILEPRAISLPAMQ